MGRPGFPKTLREFQRTFADEAACALTTWFWAAYLMTTDKRGVSALLVQRQLDLSYKTAWLLLPTMTCTAGSPDARFPSSVPGDRAPRQSPPRHGGWTP